MTFVTFRLVLMGLSVATLACLQAISVRAGSQPRRTGAAAVVNRKSPTSPNMGHGGGTPLVKAPEKSLPEKNLPERKVPSQKLPDEKRGAKPEFDF
jgi:hypothetical protein